MKSHLLTRGSLSLRGEVKTEKREKLPFRLRVLGDDSLTKASLPSLLLQSSRAVSAALRFPGGVLLVLGVSCAPDDFESETFERTRRKPSPECVTVLGESGAHVSRRTPSSWSSGIRRPRTSATCGSSDSAGRSPFNCSPSPGSWCSLSRPVSSRLRSSLLRSSLLRSSLLRLSLPRLLSMLCSSLLRSSLLRPSLPRLVSVLRSLRESSAPGPV